MFADAGVTGWGWAIDNLEIQQRILDVGKNDVPVHFALEQNYPNPFNPATTIRYAIPKAARTILKIYTVNGQEVETLVNTPQPSGAQTYTGTTGPP